MVRLALIALSIALVAPGCDSVADGKARRAGEGRPAADADQGGGAGQANQPKTRLIGTLLNLLEGVKTDDQQAKDDVRSSLVTADEKLQSVLGENSREAIMRANNKPLVPLIQPYPVVPSRPTAAKPPADQPTPADPRSKKPGPTSAAPGSL